MALGREGSRTPTSIGKLTVILIDYNGADPTKKARYQIQVLDENGIEMGTLKGNLVPHIRQGEIDGLVGFMNSLRTQAENEVLPV